MSFLIYAIFIFSYWFSIIFCYILFFLWSWLLKSNLRNISTDGPFVNFMVTSFWFFFKLVNSDGGFYMFVYIGHNRWCGTRCSWTAFRYYKGMHWIIMLIIINSAILTRSSASQAWLIFGNNPVIWKCMDPDPAALLAALTRLLSLCSLTRLVHLVSAPQT